MRATVRWLTFLAPVTLLLLFAIHYYEVPAIVRQRLPGAPLLDSIGFSRPKHDESPLSQPSDNAPISIPDLWQQWSLAFYEARVQAPAISLLNSAQLSRVNDDYQIRTPFEDLIWNESADLESIHKSHNRFLQKLDKADMGIDSFKGTGVVMVGGGEYFGPSIIGIEMLRRTGSTLPVEVFIPTNKEYEAELCEQYLPRLNARCVLLPEMISHAQGPSADLEISHYQLKSLALLLSSFAEVLLLDSDSIPLVDPEKTIFGVEPYKSHGLIVWPDYWLATESPQFWSTVVGLPEFPKDLPATSSEAGQLAINKKTHMKPLLLATYYNIFGPSHYYPLLSQGALGQGDKETFMAAAIVLNSTYYRVKKSVSMIGRHNGEEYKGTAMIQHLPSDDLARSNSRSQSRSEQTQEIEVKPSFLHSNTPKMNAGHLIDEGDLLSQSGNKRLRLLGSKSDQIKIFGYDIEKTIWDLLVQTGCELAHVIREWKDRDRLCERLEEHYELVFKGDIDAREGGNRR